MTSSRRLAGDRRLRVGGAGAEPIVLQVKPDWRTTVTALGSILAVLGVAVGLYVTNDANRKQQEATGKQQELAMQQQVADRFSAAIDQLGQEDEKGSSKLSIRLGGIYGLQRLMIDSSRDIPAVVQVLSAFVRTHAPRPDPRPRVVPSPPADVRAAVTVLARRPQADWNKLDFSNTLLGLDHMNLRGADATGTKVLAGRRSGSCRRNAHWSAGRSCAGASRRAFQAAKGQVALTSTKSAAGTPGTDFTTLAMAALAVLAICTADAATSGDNPAGPGLIR